jgi:hypothetical protein
MLFQVENTLFDETTRPMQLWTDWLTLAGICILGAMSPGPSLAVIVRHSVWKRGR